MPIDFRKYKSYPIIPVTQQTRQWPEKRITTMPRLCSVDLRDGNQALADPMDLERKLKLYHCLLGIGFKEIEVGFPSASETDYAFIRHLIDNQLIPDDVLIQVLVPAREELIAKTISALVGASKVVIHLYNSTSKQQREQVFCKSREQIVELALSGVAWIVEEIKSHPETDWQLEYSPESFTGTELDFALTICNAVSEKWINATGNGLIINLPSTVELSTPNIYADQIEWMSAHLAYRDKICLSIHPHNDRGTAIASAELGILAGADRVEGTLFGNGERTGNVDLINLALNCTVQGIDSTLELSNLPDIVNCVEDCNQLRVPPRHPYAGSLVFTAFSGSHQDAIKKSLVLQSNKNYWDVPYLPIDPNDIGRSYEEVIRINGQSGKGGIAYLLEHHFGIRLPRGMLITLQQTVQKIADEENKEVNKESIYQAFSDQFIKEDGPLRFININALDINDAATTIAIALCYNSEDIVVQGSGNGVLDSAIKALEARFNISLSVVDYTESALTQSSQAEAIAYLSIKIAGDTFYGVGISSNIAVAPLIALISAMNRFLSCSTQA
ncbi:2-isopropylmalate synthase [Pragia fontium]|uniref:2-isopropylmalate synthase n=1 Tax=Pragia fontium DSM 5563 = ATCC 49100 TaxID=1122977 RepID=A0AAJ4W8H2_9GAMM|nr:2-isopropylmalate synthase [Pragia fontium]SFC18834.1 2-isopropylmalate synthase [Pragia fontium DSM 5563 = ATCC 49100]VEJ53278.1 2-isopropylmalate synthase [Pragia fontium]